MSAAIAQWRDVPEFEIADTEASELMQATQNVLRHYSIETTQKGADMIALFGVVAMITGTRISAYNLRKRMEREQAPSNFRPTVIPMPQAPRPSSASPPPSAPGAPAYTVSAPAGPIDDGGGFG